jgi:carboxyl-terminal processing protease
MRPLTAFVQKLSHSRASRGENQLREWFKIQRCAPLSALIGGLLFVTACTTTTPAPPPKSSAVQTMLSSAFSNVHEIYLNSIDMDVLALEGLKGLSHIEPAATFIRDGDEIQLRINGTLVGHAGANAPNDSAAWAKVVDALLLAGKRSSAKLRDVDDERIYKVIFSGFLDDMDRYSRYAGMEQARRDRASRDGFGGVGVSIKPDSKGARIVRISQNSPAARAGVQNGDIIIAVNGVSLTGKALAAIVDLLRGPVGRKVAIMVRRASLESPFIAIIPRKRIIPDTVHYEARGAAAYFRITSFNQNTTNQLKRKVRKAQRELGSSLAGLVLDLRNNPGGLLTQAVEAADLFIEHGRISETTGRHHDSIQRFDSTIGDITNGLPIAVLMNGASASSAEIMAAALQDNGRAILIGSNSFGKGTVQTVLRMPNDGELILTWARLLAPSGYVLNRLGVLPNICTSDAEDADSLLKTALENHLDQRRATFSLRRSVRKDDASANMTVQTSCPWRPREGTDIDVDIATRVLESGDLYKRAVAISTPVAGS